MTESAIMDKFKFMRTSVIVINVLFLIGAALAFMFGIHLMLESKEHEFEKQHNISQSSKVDPKLNLTKTDQPPEEMNAETLIIFAIITVVIALLGICGAMRQSFWLLMLFAKIVLISLMLRIIILITFPNHSDPISTAYSALFALVEFILAVFSILVAFHSKRSHIRSHAASVSIVRTPDARGLVTIAESTEFPSSVKSSIVDRGIVIEVDVGLPSIREHNEAETEVTTSEEQMKSEAHDGYIESDV